MCAPHRAPRWWHARASARRCSRATRWRWTSPSGRTTGLTAPGTWRKRHAMRIVLPAAPAWTAMTTDIHPQTILHLGLGSFHRAPQALYLPRLHALGERRWVLAGGNLRPDMQDSIAALQAQHGAYTLETVSARGE